MAKLPGQRSLEECRRRGWTAQMVEKWVPQARRRIDLFGIIDIIALDGLPGCLGIQATTSTNHSSHVSKALDEPRLLLWLEAGNRFQVWSWGKKGPRGKRKTWQLRTETLDGTRPNEG